MSTSRVALSTHVSPAGGFRHGDVVLALVGRTWWPAYIEEVADAGHGGSLGRGRDLVGVFFFGDHKVGRWPMKRLRPWSELASAAPRGFARDASS